MPNNFDTNPRTARNRANNKHKTAKLKELTATLKIKGKPLYQAGQIITMKGVASMYEGEWRITKASHMLGKDGYFTTLELSRNATNAPATTGSTNTLVEGNGVLNAKTEIPKSEQLKTSTGDIIPQYDHNGNRVK